MSDEAQIPIRRKFTGPLSAIKLLVVDPNRTCREVVSKMLLSRGYEVMTATRASDALSLIGDKKNEINLVLVEAQLPDMEIYEFVEKMKEISNLSSFIMTSYDNDTPSISRALKSGAKFCLRRPVKISDLQELWRFTVWNRYREIPSDENTDFSLPMLQWIIPNKGLECGPSMNTQEQSGQSANGKEKESPHKDTSGLGKRKICTWTDDLHRKFMEAVEIAGINASPMKIFELMDVEGVTKESISNYLQKYRQSMKLRASAMAEHVNGYVSLTIKSPRKRSHSLEKEDVTNNATITQKDLSDSMPANVFDSSAHSTSLESSTFQEAPLGKNQPCLPSEQQGVADTTSSLGSCINGDAPEKIIQDVNTTNGETIGLQLPITTLLGFDVCDPLFPINLMPPLPPDEQKKYDDLFHLKGNEMFTDDDLNMWLSSNPDNVNNDDDDGDGDGDGDDVAA